MVLKQLCMGETKKRTNFKLVHVNWCPHSLDNIVKFKKKTVLTPYLGSSFVNSWYAERVVQRGTKPDNNKKKKKPQVGVSKRLTRKQEEGRQR